MNKVFDCLLNFNEKLEVNFEFFLFVVIYVDEFVVSNSVLKLLLINSFYF